MIEEWQAVVGYEGLYEVSSYGNVKSLERQGANERILKQQLRKHGYLRVSLSKKNIPTDRLVNRLVLEAFVGKCPDGMETYHVDSDPINNRLENLRWDTHKNNIAEAIRRGTFYYRNGKKEKDSMVEVTIEYLTQGEWKETTVKLDVDADMTLTDSGLDQEMCALPRLISKYAEVAAELHAQAARKKSRVEAVEAEVAMDIRRIHAAAGTKITEPGIKEAVATSAVTTAARNAFYHADSQFRMVDGFYRALREKASLSIALCYKQKAEISAMSGPLN